MVLYLSVITQLAWFGREDTTQRNMPVRGYLIKCSVFQNAVLQVNNSSQHVLTTDFLKKHILIRQRSACRHCRLCVSRPTRKSLERRADILKIQKAYIFPVYLDTPNSYYTRESVLKAMFNNSSKKTSHLI